MFDNLLYQNASELLSQDIRSNRLPGSILLAGPASSGKLTCALEIGRVLSCTGDEVHPKGHWLCECPSCKKNKELSNPNVLLAGPRDCFLEIAAAKKAFLQAAYDNSKSLTACRYLFLRSVRKLTNRFSQILWEDDDKVSKIAQLMQLIDEEMGKLSMDKTLPENDQLEKIVAEIVKQCEKLESTFMYDALPISQIRKAAAWAHMKSVEGKKIFIIENAERMLEAARNALLKILEEPPSDVVFILTTSNRGAVMPTILSRVRTYSFAQRTVPQENEVIERVFHADSSKNISIDSYLQTFLPITPAQVRTVAESYFNMLMKGQIPMASGIAKQCGEFKPEVLLKNFLIGIMDAAKKDPQTAGNVSLCQKVVEYARSCYSNVTTYNQSATSALENLTRDLSTLRKAYQQ
ncbi:MAG: DNA polymerase III [Treponema sp.]|nr:DNA polymerase III [Candidatus Treponema equifaecale]